MSTRESTGVLATLLIAIAIVAAALVFTSRWRVNVGADETIEVTGSAKKNITSDLGVLHTSVNVRGNTSIEAYNSLQEQSRQLQAFFREHGVPAEALTVRPLNVNANEEFTQHGMTTGRIRDYSANQQIDVTLKDVKKVEELSLAVSQLVEKGIVVNGVFAEYYYTKLAELKVEMQTEAAKNALERATKIAKATGRDLGTLKSARMGVIQITPVNSNQVQDYGVNDNSSIEKEITTVVNASFLLK